MQVVPVASLLPTALALGDKIAALSKPIVRMAKEAANAAYEMSLAEGLERERRLFHSTFATADQKVRSGYNAF